MKYLSLLIFPMAAEQQLLLHSQDQTSKHWSSIVQFLTYTPWRHQHCWKKLKEQQSQHLSFGLIDFAKVSGRNPVRQVGGELMCPR